MGTISKQQVEKLLEDIASIKEVIQENKSLLREFLLPVHFKMVSIIAGIAIIFFSLLYDYLFRIYGSYSKIPPMIQYSVLSLALFAYILVIVLKRVLWMRSLKRYDSSITWIQMVKTLFTSQLLHVWIPIVIIMLVFVLYLIQMGMERYIVTATSLGMGIIYNSIGSISRIYQYTITGYWLLVTGFLPILFSEVSALIFLAVTVGAAMLLFVAISQDNGKREE